MFKVCELDNCGHLLCKKCVKKIKDCPICKNRNVYYHTSKYLQRKLYDQEVKCTIPKCNKIFTLAETDEHISKYHEIEGFYIIPPTNNIKENIAQTRAYTIEPENGNNNINLLFQFTISGNIDDLINIFKWLRNVSGEISIKINKNGVEVINIIKNKTSLCFIKFKIDKFKNFTSLCDIIVNIKIDDLVRILNMSDNNDTLTFEYIEYDSPMLQIIHVSNKSSLTIEHLIKINIIKQINYTFPRVPMDCIAIVPFIYLEFFSDTNSKVKILCNKDGIHLFKKYGNNTDKITINKEKMVEFKITEKFINIYASLDLITSFAKFNKKENIYLSFKNDFPLIAKYDTTYTEVTISITNMEYEYGSEDFD